MNLAKMRSLLFIVVTGKPKMIWPRSILLVWGDHIVSDSLGAVVLVGAFLLVAVVFRCVNARAASRPVVHGLRVTSTDAAVAFGTENTSSTNDFGDSVRVKPSFEWHVL
ncbi:hypothetical protein GS979_07480 [Rhodococcus hoagii]|nr:hypothetical protein [Prescottella equi]NKW46242.1 hypothetical protein [Prescottella equi]